MIPLGLVAVEQHNHDFKLYFSEEMQITMRCLGLDAYNNFIVTQFNEQEKWVVISINAGIDYKALNQVIKDLKIEHLERKLAALLEAERVK